MRTKIVELVEQRLNDKNEIDIDDVMQNRVYGDFGDVTYIGDYAFKDCINLVQINSQELNNFVFQSFLQGLIAVHSSTCHPLHP